MSAAPIALALGSGMLATINPCAFVMLPSLVSFYLGADEAGYRSRPIMARLRDGIAFGLATTTGFVAVFSALGLVISFGAAGVAQYLPWGTVLIGAGLVGLGLWLFAGRHLFLRLPTWQAPLRSGSVRAMTLYGIAYAVASLSCTLPVFLVVVGTSLVAGPGRLLVFLAYGLGMGIVLTAVALSAVLFEGALTRYLRSLLPYIQQIGALLLVVAGIYMVTTELPVLAHQSAWVNLMPGV
jgi:cytochrome c biogenesis protein CcdA